jgi:hypothetical protein
VSCAESAPRAGPWTSFEPRRAASMLIVLIAFTVLLLLGMPVAFAIGI